ncbi:hypothetical protein L6V77_07710 [Myxococcota bacterium]|nr:hypothetical protein [Myxococcota bacterium]
MRLVSIGFAVSASTLPVGQAAEAIPARPTAVQAGIKRLAGKLGAALAKGGGHLRLAVLPFEEPEAAAEAHSLGRLSAELLSSRLVLEPRVLLVERDRLDAVVSELRRGERGELSAEGAASVGKLLGATSVVLGSVVGAGPSYIVTARVVDAETGQILVAADQDLPKEGLVALSEDVVEVRSRSGAALRSAAFPGWGQLYNGDVTRGVTYIAVFAGLAAGAVASASLGAAATDDYHRNQPGTVSRRDDANTHHQRTNIALVGLGLVWSASLLDAWLTGEDASVVDLEAIRAGDGEKGHIDGG